MDMPKNRLTKLTHIVGKTVENIDDSAVNQIVIYFKEAENEENVSDTLHAHS